MWLGRLIDKCRHFQAASLQPGQLLGEYMLGANDYLDSKLLRFLGLRDDRIAEIVRDEPNDDRAASRIIEASGKSAAECDAFNRAFAKSNALWLAMIDADEGKRKPGIGTSLLKSTYNSVIFPMALRKYRSDSRQT